MANLPLKPYSQAPMVDDGNMRDFLTWVHVSLNQLIGQANATPQQGFQALINKQLDPTTSQLISLGGRITSVTSLVAFTSTTTSITFYWDGTNGSDQLQIYRDDGTIIGPTLVGSPVTVSGLTANTLYFFYLYWDETLQRVAMVPGQVGTPPFAFTAKSLLAAQQQQLATRIPLAPFFTTTGITTPAAGTGGGGGGTGGGGGGGRGGGLK
jgi:hypothetical protein